jgi:hypothetical protein
MGGFDIRHDLTAKGMQQFVADYNSTLKQSARVYVFDDFEQIRCSGPRYGRQLRGA